MKTKAGKKVLLTLVCAALTIAGDGSVKKTSQKNVYRLGKMKMKVFKKKVVIKNSDAAGVYKLKKRYYS